MPIKCDDHKDKKLGVGDTEYANIQHIYINLWKQPAQTGEKISKAEAALLHS